MEQLQNYQENIHKVVSKEGLEYLHGVIVGVIKHSAKQRELQWRESMLLVGPQLAPEFCSHGGSFRSATSIFTYHT